MWTVERHEIGWTVGRHEITLAGLSIHHGDHNGYLSLVSAKFGTPRYDRVEVARTASLFFRRSVVPFSHSAFVVGPELAECELEWCVRTASL